MSLGERHRQWAGRIVEALDALSRTRELEALESETLEWAIGIADGKTRNMRQPHGSGPMLLRMGIRRDLSIYRPNQKIVGVKRHTEQVDSREDLRGAMERRQSR